jgi:hypothetical protein
MSVQDVYVRSERALADVIEEIRPEQWDQVKPAWFHTGRQGDVTLRELVNYHAYDTAWVPDVLSGATMAEVGDRYESIKAGAQPIDYRAISEKAVAAALNLDDLDRVVHLSYGDYPARDYLKHITSFRGFRAYDIARWIGVSTALPEELVQGMWDELEPEMDAWRQWGVYSAEVAVASDAPLQDRLLGRAGRDPSAVGTDR